MQKKTLEINCYVLGAGAFGVFFRWLQDQMAFNEEGLADPSVFHVLVPLFILAAAGLFLRFVDKARNKRYYLPEDFSQALRNEGRLFAAIRYTAGAVMALGGLLLFAASEVEKEAFMLRILSLLALLSGAAYPVLLGEANREKPRIRLSCLCALAPVLLFAFWLVTSYKINSINSVLWAYPILLNEANREKPRIRLSCLCALAPVLLFAFWLVTSYKINSINSVLWAYAIEIVAIIIALLSFFRMAGFPFGCANPWRAIFFAMLGTAMCIMALADSRLLGMQLMFAGAAMMLMLCNWIMIHNLQRKEAPIRYQPDDGFERL